MNIPFPRSWEIEESYMRGLVYPPLGVDGNEMGKREESREREREKETRATTAAAATLFSESHATRGSHVSTCHNVRLAFDATFNRRIRKT